MPLIATRSAILAPWLALLVTGGVSTPAATQVVYEPTPYETVERMLALADVRASDYLFDLGSGDGRIPIAAARRGARALGVDFDPARVRESRANAERAGVADRVRFRQENLFRTPLGEATVITLYLLPELNLKLRPRLLSLRPGTRIVSHRFLMGDWKPDVTDAAGGIIHLWVVPARVQGRWHLQAGEQRITLRFTQRHQQLSGMARSADGISSPVVGRMRGDEVEFSLALPGLPMHFRGRVAGDRMEAATGPLGFGARSWVATRH